MDYIKFFSDLCDEYCFEKNLDGVLTSLGVYVFKKNNLIEDFLITLKKLDVKLFNLIDLAHLYIGVHRTTHNREGFYTNSYTIYRRNQPLKDYLRELRKDCRKIYDDFCILIDQLDIKITKLIIFWLEENNMKVDDIEQMMEPYTKEQIREGSKKRLNDLKNYLDYFYIDADRNLVNDLDYIITTLEQELQMQRAYRQIAANPRGVADSRLNLVRKLNKE